MTTAKSPLASNIIIRELGECDYLPIWQKMQAFTQTRESEQTDEIWWVEHPAVFTQGQAGKEEHLLMPGDIPVVKVDRGGQVTYHGPGQLVGYTLIDIKRKGIGVRTLVSAIEQSIVDLLQSYAIEAYAKKDAPGVYVNEQKIASLGLRIRRGCSFHGLALNVAMDLAPFQRINPCGYQGLQMTQTSELGGPQHIAEAKQALTKQLVKHLEYTNVVEKIGFENE
ncbi:lipoate-protein ligase B [Catenovulum agarivorans DS-2]|uniref:Octanoyltransferase n=1 Tax=Catenovulum agarivorans DS-2 TaxID=1328313 RepID=W7QSI7_9ALTE|nr:lipoyl(octanoyl) transferase LipB [Catenovulum agarivorans]EWH08350.1 lipoate-protein ligase B [Catenovulum agarivorans DS-2]